MRYSRETRASVLKDLISNKNEYTSKEIAEKLKVPDFYVRRIAVENNLRFGHYTPFKANPPIKISDELDEIIVGSLLGDGTITEHIHTATTSRNKNSKLSIKHCINQKNYALFKHSLMESNVKCHIEYRDVIDKRGWNSQNTICVNTTQNSSFNIYRDIWYPQGIKIIPNSLKEITPLSLAIWYQDDGYISKSGGYYFSTDCFSRKSIKYLGDLLLNKYGLRYSIHSSLGKYRLYIRRSEIEKFNYIVNPYIERGMRYKLHKNSHCPQ